MARDQTLERGETNVQVGIVDQSLLEGPARPIADCRIRHSIVNTMKNNGLGSRSRCIRAAGSRNWEQ